MYLPYHLHSQPSMHSVYMSQQLRVPAEVRGVCGVVRLSPLVYCS